VALVHHALLLTPRAPAARARGRGSILFFERRAF
jgi:hypothetical protein